MKLPYRKNAIVPRRKLTDYLLSLTHEKGKSKARFFRNIGFNETNIKQFEEALLTIAKDNEVDGEKISKDENRVTYPIFGFINAPNGKKCMIKTVWVLEHGSNIPHLTTAHPGSVYY